MKKVVLVFIVLLSYSLSSLAQKQDLKQAHSLYLSAHYVESIAAYEKLLQGGVESAALYYNLGNAYYRTGKIAASILNYERALKLDPNNKDAKYNLELVNSKKVDRINSVDKLFFVQWIDSLRDMSNSNSWAIKSIVFFIFFILLSTVFLFAKYVWLRKTAFFSAIFLVCVAVVCFVFSYQQKERIVNVKEAIVFSQTVSLKSSPDDSGTDLFFLHEGTKVIIKSELGKWFEVQTEDGTNVGWLQTNTIVKI